MFQFFNSFAQIVNIVIDFVVSAVEMVVFLFTNIPKAIGYVVSVVAYLPPFLSTFVMLFVAIIVVLNLLNKGS